MATTKALPELIAEVSATLQRIEKRGTAPQAMGGFPFVRTTDVMDALKPALDERGIILRPLYRSLDAMVRERDRGYTMVLTVELELWAVHGAEELLLARTIGMGADTQDKASGKAQTSALKEAILKAFAIPTGDDPESQHIDTQPRRQSAQNARRASPARDTTNTPSGGKAGDVSRINALLKEIDQLESQTVNRYSVRAHVRRELSADSVGEVLSKGSDEARAHLIDYLERKLDEATGTTDDAASAQMTDEEALAAGAALLER